MLFLKYLVDMHFIFSKKIEDTPLIIEEIQLDDTARSSSYFKIYVTVNDL